MSARGQIIISGYGLLVIIGAAFYEFAMGGELINLITFDGTWVKTKLFVVFGVALFVWGLIGFILSFLRKESNHSDESSI